MIEKNLKTASKLLNDFGNFINNRPLASLVIFDNNFSKILRWHFLIWKKEYRLLNKENKLDQWSNYGELSRTLDLILKNIEKRCLQERETFSFFKSFEKHAEKYKNNSIKGKGKREFYYIESLFEIFYHVFFENIEGSPERFDIWNHYFPDKWKVTKDNLENKENIIVRISLYRFLEWAQNRIWKSEEEFDQNLDDVARNLFPETDPILWAKILIFVLSPYGKNRVESVIERPWNFGFIGRVKMNWVPAENTDKKLKAKIGRTSEAENTFELLYLLAKTYPVFKIFSKKDLGTYVRLLINLKGKYSEGPEETKRLRLLYIFRKMLEFLEDKNK